MAQSELDPTQKSDGAEVRPLNGYNTKDRASIADGIAKLQQISSEARKEEQRKLLEELGISPQR